MSASLPLLSPLVTRIIELSGFPPQLKTRDIQAIFAQWEDDRGGFKIKWVDDTTALVIFADAATAKRAYLHTLMSPPPSLMNSTGISAKVRPYDGDDASSIIASVQNRPRGRSNAGAVAEPAYGGSPSASPAQAVASPRSANRGLQSLGHRRAGSGSNPSSLPPKPLAAALYDAANGGPSPAHHLANAVAAEEEAHGPEALASIQAAGGVLPGASINPNGSKSTSPRAAPSIPGAPASLPPNPLAAASQARTSPQTSKLGAAADIVSATPSGSSAGRVGA
ncbi:hypothetical protein IE81DRAFT_319972 [Ceraceosorus guamensis]|uniref:Thc1 RRM domain-containing protein n=1 Tax=Ceraceosorus guamensis TaxID=1522189 RepID=A0A316W6V6_9BASI|nr:hypothetical protein IE81DRAFT_319972 [Ceraceosorus guamensis]PWN45676.1 hypothetical protein IE81DRAFT_319972 [Ceraceosorus guamensis]